MGGMTAAGRLAALGHQVHVIEAGSTPGGKCRSVDIEGHIFDTGPSLLTLPATYRDFFLKTGDPIPVELQPVDPAFQYRFADGSAITLPNAPSQRIVHAIAEQVSEAAGSDWQALLRTAERMWDVSRGPFIESELSWHALLRRRTLLRDLHAIAPWQTLAGLARTLLRDWRLRMILWRYATYTGSDPRRCPAVLSSIAYVEQTFGAWHIPGGVSRLADAVHQRCLDLGVTFGFDIPVTEILIDGQRVTGVRLSDGSEIAADVVVANADAGQVYSTLLPELARTRSARRRLTRSEPSLAGFVILLGLRGRTPDDRHGGLHHHTVLFPEDYTDEFDAIFTRHEPVPDPTIYICAPEDAEMRPDDDSESWFILVNAPRHDDRCNWNQVDAQRYADHIIALIEARTGWAIRDRIAVQQVRTPADLEREVRAPGGSIYGTSSNGMSAAFLRAANRAPIDGLYCAGGSAHPGGGLPLVAISGEIVAEAIGRA